MNMPGYLKTYIYLNSLAAYTFLFFIISPLYAADMGLSIKTTGVIFSSVYAFQALMSYILGRLFEKYPPNFGIVFGRIVFSFGPLILALTRSPFYYTLALILASFFDIFFPAIPLLERAIIPPRLRDRVYIHLIAFGETAKFFALSIFLFVDQAQFYRYFFLSVFAAALVYSLVFIVKIPIVKSGSVVHEDQDLSIDRRTFLITMLNQLLVFLAFNFSSWIVISFYLKEILHGTTNDMVIFEMMFSIGCFLAFLFSKKFLKLSLRFRLVLGTFLMSLLFFLISVPRMTIFYISNLVFGFGFTLWLSSKEPLKFLSAPKELGRWEGLVQGINIFSRIFFPSISAFLVETLSYRFVMLVGGFTIAIASLMSLGVRD